MIISTLTLPILISVSFLCYPIVVLLSYCLVKNVSSGPDLDCDHNYPPDVIKANIVAGINPCTWDPRVSDASKRIIKRLLVRNPAKRPDAQQV